MTTAHMPPASTPDAANEVVVRVRGLVNRFGTQTVHDGLDLEVRRGEILGIVGGSGTGKSVLMRTIVGLHRPDAGHIEVLGMPVCPCWWRSPRQCPAPSCR